MISPAPRRATPRTVQCAPPRCEHRAVAPRDVTESLSKQSAHHRASFSTRSRLVMTSHTSFARAYTHTLTAPCAAYMTHVAASAPTPAASALARAASAAAVAAARAASALAQHALATFNVKTRTARSRRCRAHRAATTRTTHASRTRRTPRSARTRR